MGANVSTVMVVVALATGLWWGFLRGRRQGLLELLSMVALALAVATLVVEGLCWQFSLWRSRLPLRCDVGGQGTRAVGGGWPVEVC